MPGLDVNILNTNPSGSITRGCEEWVQCLAEEALEDSPEEAEDRSVSFIFFFWGGGGIRSHVW